MYKYLLVLLMCGCSAGAINVSVSGNKLDSSSKMDSSVKTDTKISNSTNNSKPVNNSFNTVTNNNQKSTSVNTNLKVSLK